MRSDTWPNLRRRAGAPLAAALWLAAALASAWLCWAVLLPSAGARSFGFASYYTSARLALAGELGPQIYDNAWFQGRERALGLRDDIFGAQPPTMALLMTPVAWMPPDVARAAWLALDLLWLVGIGALAAGLARRAGAAVGPAHLAAMLILVAVFRPLHAELRYAQVYTLLALWYAAWLYGYASGRGWLCGLALAGLALAKLAGAPLWVVLLATRRWRALAWSVGLTLAGLGLTLPAVGWQTWQAYLFGRVGSLATGGLFGVTALQTNISLLRQLFVLDPQYTPAPLLDAPWLAAALWVGIAAGLLWLTMRAPGPRPKAVGDIFSGGASPPWTSSLLTGAAAICLVVPLQPAGEQHHYTIILAPLLVAALLIGGGGRPAPAAAALFGLAMGLLLAPAYFLDNAAWAGWPRALLAYPRLYGSLALWGALLALRGGEAQKREFPSPEPRPRELI